MKKEVANHTKSAANLAMMHPGHTHTVRGEGGGGSLHFVGHTKSAPNPRTYTSTPVAQRHDAP